jgi:hypothetical protein
MATAPPAALGTLECSSFHAVRVDRIIATRWRGTAEPAEFAQLTAFIQRAKETTGGKVDLFAIVTKLDFTPPASVREAMVAFAKETRDALEATDIVLLGKSGFWQTIVRSIITNLIFVARAHRQTTVHATVDDALAGVCARRGLDRETLRAALVEHAILESADLQLAATAS